MIDHHHTCARRWPPVLISGWDGRPLTQCPDCGRTAPADTTKPEPRTP